MMSYEEYELECRKQIERNEKFLEMFERDLVSVSLSQTTIRKHLSNVDFYINTYLLREEPLGMERGCFKIDTFFGYFFIHKCMWSTPGNIKTTAASIKSITDVCLKINALKRQTMFFCVQKSRNIWRSGERIALGLTQNMDFIE